MPLCAWLVRRCFTAATIINNENAISCSIALESLHALGVLDHPEERTMGDVIDFHGLDPKIAKERTRVARALRDLAQRLEAAPPEKLLHALPIAASSIEDLTSRLSVWLRLRTQA